MRARILVTRPEPGGSATAARLARAGFAPVLLPLTEIVPLPAELPPGDFDVAAVTSANAVRHASPALLAHLAGIPWFAVGGETARAASEARLRDVVAGDGDALALARRVVAATRPGARIAYLAGRVRRDDFEAALKEAGRHVTAVETYDTRPVAYTTSDLATALGGPPLDAVLLYSGKAAEALAALPDAGLHFGRVRLFGLSVRIGAALPAEWRKRFRAAGTPDEDALFRLIDDTFPPAP